MLLELRDALDRVPIDDDAIRMMDGIEAAAASDWDKAAAIGAGAPVRDGMSEDLVRFLVKRAELRHDLHRAASTMHLVSWTLHAVGLAWRGRRDELRALDRNVRRACDILLFQPACMSVGCKPACSDRAPNGAVGWPPG